MSGEGVYHNQEPHKRLLAWQRSIDFVVVVYELTKKLPKEEEFGLKGPAENDGIPSSGERAPAWNISEPNSRLKIER